MANNDSTVMNKKILVIDDEPLFLEVLSTVLTEEGFTVEYAEKADSIYSLLDSFKPDLLILDIRIADVDGRTICNELKQHPFTKNLPIIMLTGISYEEISELDCYADAIIGKPYKYDNLLLTIKQLLLN